MKDSPSPSDGSCSRENVQGNRSTVPVMLTDQESCGVDALDGDKRGCFFRNGHEVSASDDEDSFCLSLAAQGGCIQVGCIH